MKKLILLVLLVLITPLIKIIPVNALLMNYETLLTLNVKYTTVIEDDINSDGYMDFYVSGSNYTGAYLNDKDMTFTKVDIDTVGSYESHKNNAQVVDFNGDGYKDFVYGAANVKVAYSNGDGTFDTPVSLYAERASALHAADYDKDGKMDLAISYDNGSRIMILYQGNNGTFAAPQDPVYGGDIAVYYGGSRVNNIKSLDINNDGFLDLVFSDGNKFKLYSLLNENFDEYDMYETLYTASATVNTFLLNDFDSDNDLDIIVATNYSVGTQTTVLSLIKNNGNGFDDPFSVVDLSSADYSTYGGMSSIKDLAMLSVDPTQGLLHLVTGHEATASQFGLNVFDIEEINDEIEIVGRPITQRSKGVAIANVMVGDFNGDGSLDVMGVGNGISDTKFYFHQSDNKGFKLSFDTNGGTPINPIYGVNFGLNNNVASYAAGTDVTFYDYDLTDVDSNNQEELFLSFKGLNGANYQQKFEIMGSGISVVFNPEAPDVGNYRIEMLKTFYFQNSFYALGYDTLSNKIYAFQFNLGTSKYSILNTVADLSKENLGETYNVAFGDNSYADTHIEMIQLEDESMLVYVTDQGTGNTYVFSYGFLGDGNYLGKIKDGSDNVITLSQPYAIKTSYFNDDNYRDFVTGDAGAAENLTLLLGTSDPLVFNKSVITTQTGRYQYLDVADFNGDELMDIVATDSESSTLNKVVVFLNDGDDTFTATTISNFGLLDYQSNTLSYKDVTARDIEGDGDIDVLVRSASQYNPSMFYLNQGDGTFDKGHYINEIIRTGGYSYIEHMDVIGDAFGLGYPSIVAFTYTNSRYYTVMHSIYQSDLSTVLPANPTKTNATFLGWYTDEALTIPYVDGTPITSDTTLYADWESQLLSVTFKDQFGTTLKTVEDLEPNSALTGVTYPTLSPVSGYTFTGWDASIPASIGETSLVITAEYDPNSYTISFNENGGSAVTDITADYDSVVTEPVDPTKTGHTFAGWYSDSGLTTPFTFDKMPLNGATLYAKWTLNQYSITIKGGEGEKIVSIFQGQTNGFVLTDAGRILAYGPNYGLGFNGGDGNATSITDMVEIFTLNSGETIVLARNGDGFFYPFNFFLTSEGRVLVLGTNAETTTPVGTLATGDETLINTLTPIDITANFNLGVNEKVIDIHLGRYAGVALTNEGRVFTWGKNQYGTAGNNTIYVAHHSPTDITSYFNLESGDKITLITMSLYSVMAVSENGSVYGWGWHAYNQTLGLGNTNVQYYKVPTQLTLPLEAGETITKISLGMTSGLVITSNNRVIHWSSPILNGGGSLPTVVEDLLLPNEIVLDINMGYSSGYIITDQRVLARGSGSYGLLGDGINGGNTNGLWVDITSNFGFTNGEKITQIDVFYMQVLALTNQGRLLFFGYNSYFDEVGATGTTAPTEITVDLQESSDRVYYFNYGEDISDFTLDDKGNLYFRGFFTDELFANGYTLDTMPDEDLILYAYFTPLSTYDMSGVKWDYESAFTYNGTEFTVTLDESTLPDGVTVKSYTLNKGTTAGTYIATVIFNYDTENYLEPTIASLSWVINKATYDMDSVAWPETTYTYNGNEQTVTLNGLPEGVTAQYTNNKQTAAGTYTVLVTFTYDEDNYNEPTFNSFSWTINKATYNFSGVAWSTATYTYTGSQQTISLTGLPQGVTANYTNHQQTNAGTYTVSVTFDYDEDNYNEPTFSDFSWTINKATYNFGSAAWQSTPYTYNGTQQIIVINGLPQGVTANYTNNQQTNAGTYTVSVTFDYDEDNYNEPSMSDFSWTIVKATYNMSSIVWEYVSAFTYSGDIYTVRINEGDLPNGVSVVSYSNNSFSAAGSYTASVTFDYDEDNYNDPSIENLSWTINKNTFDFSAVAWPNGTYTYNGSQQTVVLTGLPQGVIANYTNNQQTNAGTYTVSVSFTYDEDNYNTLSFNDYSWTIAKAVHDMSGVSWNYSDPFVQDGSIFTVLLQGLPQGVTANYSNNSTKVPGNYVASVTFNFDSINYETVTFNSLPWTILPVYTITIDVDGVKSTFTGLIGTAVPPVTTPTKEGYLFKGWSSDIPNEIGENDLTIYATWFKVVQEEGTEDLSIEDLMNSLDLSAYGDEDVTVYVSRKGKDKDTSVNDLLKSLYEVAFDYDIFEITIVVDSSNGEINLTETNEPVTMTIKVNDEWLNHESFKLLRIKDGVVYEVTYTYDEATQTISFTTDALGVFAVSYETPFNWLWVLLPGVLLAAVVGYGIYSGRCRKFFWFILGKKDKKDEEEEKKKQSKQK